MTVLTEIFHKLLSNAVYHCRDRQVGFLVNDAPQALIEGGRRRFDGSFDLQAVLELAIAFKGEGCWKALHVMVLAPSGMHAYWHELIAQMPGKHRAVVMVCGRGTCVLTLKTHSLRGALL